MSRLRAGRSAITAARISICGGNSTNGPANIAGKPGENKLSAAATARPIVFVHPTDNRVGTSGSILGCAAWEKGLGGGGRFVLWNGSSISFAHGASIQRAAFDNPLVGTRGGGGGC